MNALAEGTPGHCSPARRADASPSALNHPRIPSRAPRRFRLRGPVSAAPPPAPRAATRYAPRSAATPPPSGGARARNNPLTTVVEAGAPITIVRSVIRFPQHGHAGVAAPLNLKSQLQPHRRPFGAAPFANVALLDARPRPWTFLGFQGIGRSIGALDGQPGPNPRSPQLTGGMLGGHGSSGRGARRRSAWPWRMVHGGNGRVRTPAPR